MLKEEIMDLARSYKDKVIQLRREFHMCPELSFCEYETSRFVKAKLGEMGITSKPMADTGLVAMIKGELSSEKVIGLRTDMDALPITESNIISFCSQNKGVMHACGHDAHMASLLGTAAILQTLRAKFAGTVMLIFQPGEEKLPGGASVMIKEGLLRNPIPVAVIGQHVMPTIQAGKIALRPGKLMASMDELIVTVRGKGGHGAMPHQNIDPVMITCYILTALQQVISRFNNPTVASVLSFGKITASGAINIIPDDVHIEGTFRTVNDQWRLEAHELMIQMATGIAKSMGGTCEFTIRRGYPTLINDEQLTNNVRRYANEYLGNDNVLEAEPLMIAEDFAYYSQEVPSCFYFLGSGNQEKNIVAPLHTPTFNIDEDIHEFSTGLMAYIALKQLQEK